MQDLGCMFQKSTSLKTKKWKLFLLSEMIKVITNR